MSVRRWGYGRVASLTAVVLLVAVAGGLGLQSGSARGLANVPSPKTYTATLAPGCVPAGGTTRLTLTLANTSPSSPLGSVDLSVGRSSGVTLSSSSPYATSGGTMLALRNLGISAGHSLQIPVDVTVAANVSASISWTIAANSNPGFTSSPGDDFQPVTLASTSICTPTLTWGTQPASAKLNVAITGTPYASGSPVTVDSTGLPDGTWVTLGLVPGPVDCPSATFSGASAQIQSGVATFGSLTGTSLGLGCELVASAGPNGPATANSNPFNVTLGGITCGASCQLGLLFPDGTQVTGTGTTGGSFHFFALTSASIPPAVTQARGGCANFSSIGATVFDESDGNTSGTGTKTFRYYVPKADIVKKYSWNSGQPFIPICAGGERVIAGQLTSCTHDPYGGWWGKTLDSKGAFVKGGYAQAVCDPATGLWWGILASFQDLSSSPNIVPGVTPIVTGWGSGKSSRSFDISVPAPWDWRAGT